MFGNTYVCESTFSTMKQVKSKNKNRMAGETLDDSLRLATNNTGIEKGTIVSIGLSQWRNCRFGPGGKT